MECLALAPLKLIVWSSDKNIIRTNIFINAHPKATVGRLLQYIHSQAYAESRIMSDNSLQGAAAQDQERDRTENSLGAVSEYCLYYRSLTELRLDSYLQELEPNSNNSFVRLQFEKKRTNSGEATNLEYDYDEEFTKTNLQLNINALSIEKVMCRMELNVPMGISMSRLKKMALKLLHDYETQRTNKNLCHVRGGHKAADIIGFLIKGEQTPIYLNDPNAQLYDDVTLSKLLGIDFAPRNDSYFTIMFKVNHGISEAEEDENSVSIEFISDSTLSMNKMSVTANTTVEEVKEFVCSAYTHSLRLSTNDVKLIYKGQLVHELDFSGHPSKIMEYINGTDGAKIHVHINQEYNEPGPGFWSELFNSPERFEFLPQRDLESQSMLPTFSSQSRATSIPMSQSGIPSSLVEIDNPKCEFVTESGLPFKVGGEPFFKCLIDGKDEVFIPAHKLEPAHVRLEFGDSAIALSSLDYKIEGGLISLPPNLISRLESQLDMEIEKNSFEAAFNTDFNVMDGDGPVPQQGRQVNNRRLNNIFPVLLIIFRTLYLIANNSIIPFFFVLELSTILSWKYTTLIAIVFLIRTIWSTREIWEIWSEFLNLNEIDEATYAKIKAHINSRSLSKQFFKDCDASNSVVDILMSSTLRDLREQLYESYNIEHMNEESGVAALKTLLKRASVDEIDKGALEDYLISCLDLYETTRETMPASYQNSMRQLLFLAKRDMLRSASPGQLSLYTRISDACRNTADRFRQSQVAIIILEHVVPDPREDTIAVSVVKNIILFFLIILPPIKNKVDSILQERARAQEHPSSEEVKNDHPSTEDGIHPIPEAPAMATGRDLRDLPDQTHHRHHELPHNTSD